MKGKEETNFCPGCGMDRASWPGSGFEKDGSRYCCHDCAENTGCSCITSGFTIPDPESSGLSHGTWKRP